MPRQAQQAGGVKHIAREAPGQPPISHGSLVDDSGNAKGCGTRIFIKYDLLRLTSQHIDKKEDILMINFNYKMVGTLGKNG